MLVGVHEDLPAEELKAKYPGVSLTRRFVSGVRPAGTDLAAAAAYRCQDDWEAGLTPLLSFKTDPEATALGHHDREIRELAMFLRNEAPVTWLIWYHEPEDNMTGEHFSPAFHRVRALIKAVYPSQVVGYAAMAYQWDPQTIERHKRIGKTHHTDNPWAWRVDADFFGCDVYSGGSTTATATFDEHMGYHRWRALAVPDGHPVVGLSERGFKSRNDEERAATIRREAEILREASLDFYVFWNTTGAENDPALVNGPQATEALRYLVSLLTRPAQPAPPRPSPPPPRDTRPGCLPTWLRSFIVS